MGTFEIVLIVAAVLTPVVALLFVLPKKIKKKEEKVVETKPYEPISKEEPPKEEVKPESQNLVKESFPSTIDNDLETYREYLKKKNLSSRPSKITIGDKSDDLTEDYKEFMERISKKEKNTEIDITELSDEMKALLILGILDRKE